MVLWFLGQPVENLLQLPCQLRRRPGREKGTSLNSTCLTPKPLAPSVYVHVPEAPSPHERSISAISLFLSRNCRWHWPSGLPGWRRTFDAIKWLEQKAFGHFGRSIDESQEQGTPKSVTVSNIVIKGERADFDSLRPPRIRHFPRIRCNRDEQHPVGSLFPKTRAPARTSDPECRILRIVSRLLGNLDAARSATAVRPGTTRKVGVRND